MPQELHVLRCFSCETFQVQIVKKSNKWECKMCGEKQSVKQVYGRGSGKDCRAHVQKLNELRLKKEEFIDPSLEKCDYQNNECSFQSVNLEAGSVATKLCRQTPKLSNENDEPSYPKKRNSKWSEFLASSSSASSDDDDAMDQSHFKPHRGDNSRKKIKKQKIASRHEEQFKLENKWNNFASNDSKVCAEDSSVHLNMSEEPTTYWRAMEGNVNSFLDVGVKNTHAFGDLGNVPDNISNSIRSKSLETRQHSMFSIPKMSGKKKICSPKELDRNNVKIVSHSKWSAFVNTEEEGSLNTFSKCPSIAACKQVKVCTLTAKFHRTNDIGKLDKSSSVVSDKKGPFNLGSLYSSQAEIGGESGNSANGMIMHRTIDLKNGEERPSYIATNCHQKTTVNTQPYIFDYNEEELDDIFNI